MSEAPSTHELPEAIFRAENLPTIPAVAVEVLRLCRDDDTTLDDLAQALQNDAALASRLLRFANSSLYDLGSEVDTLQRATLVLGMKNVQLMSLSFSLATSLPRGDDSDGFDYPTFWRRSLVRAVTARTLARRAAPQIEEESFLCGLLAELGKMVLARCLPESYDEVLNASDGWPTYGLEDERLGFRHTDVTAALLRAWELPETIAAPLTDLHGDTPLDDSVPTVIREIADVLVVAEHLTDLLSGTGGPASLGRAQEHAADLGLSEPSLDELLGGLEEDVRETARMLSIGLEFDRGFDDIVAEARNAFLDRSLDTIQELEAVKTVSDRTYRETVLAEPRYIDALTGVPNRDAFDHFLEREIDARLRGVVDRPMGLLMVAVDSLNSIEGTFGSDVRDEALRLVGTTLAATVRRFDLAVRIDEGHFAIIMGEASPFGVRALAERLRRAVETRSIEAGGSPIRVTITQGGACLAQVFGRSDGWALLEVARRYLQRATARGTNRHMVHATALRRDSPPQAESA